MIAYEAKKVLKQRGICALLLVLLALPVLYLGLRIYLTRIGDAFLPTAYVRLYQDIDTERPAEESGRLEEMGDTALLEGGFQNMYTDSIFSEMELYGMVAEELGQVDQYAAYISRTLQECQRYMSVGLFQTDASLVKNAQRTYRDFSGLTDIRAEAVPAHGVSLLFETDFTELAVVFAILLIVAVLATSEVEENTVCLLRCSARGRLQTVYAKYVAGLGILLIGWLLLYGARLLLIAASYGLPDLSVSIQSVKGCMGCVFPVSIGQMLVWFFLLKGLAYMLLFSLAFLAALFFRRFWQLCLAGMVFFGVCWIAYEQIGATSYLAYIKWFNPVAMLYTDSLLFEYRNLLLFGFAVNYLQLMLVLAGILILLCLLLIGPRFCLLQGSGRSFGEGVFHALEQGAVRMSGRRWLFGAELRKWSFYQKGLLICAAVFALLLAARFSLSQQLYTNADIYYKNYVQEMQGAYREEKLNTLYQYKEELEQLREELLQHGEEYNGSALNYYERMLDREEGLLPAIAYGEYLKEKPGASFTYDLGYQVLFGKGQGSFPLLVYRVVAAVLMVLICSMLSGMEKRTGMERLIAISRTGSGKVYRAKYKNVLVADVLISLIVYLPWTLQVLRAFGTPEISAPAYSMQMFSVVPGAVSIGGMIVLFWLGHMLYLWLVGSAAVWIGRRLNSYPVAMLASLGIALLPIIILR